MKVSGVKHLFLALILIHIRTHVCDGATIVDDYADEEKRAPAPPPEMDNCNGVFLSYSFTSRSKSVPILKNLSAQPWTFDSMATIVNAGTEEVKGWKMYIGFQHKEILVSLTNAVIIDSAGDFPVAVGNGTTISGSPSTDLKTSIDTAGDYTQIAVQILIKGSMFGLSEKTTPMPKNISLANDGWKCPKNTKYKTYMHVCCKRDPKYKAKSIKSQYMPKQNGDLTFTYDVLKSYEGSYEAQVTMDNSPIGKLDRWNLTWEWMRGEFIYSMKGAYTPRMDYSGCVYGLPGKYLTGLDFTRVLNCDKRPTITDLPLIKANDTKVGKVPYCCKNGTLLPPLMDPSKARAMFQLRVYKIPPDVSQKVLYPPQKWNITGYLNARYKCGPPIRIDPTEFPESTGLDAKTYAIASWQVVCNFTTPERRNRGVAFRSRLITATTPSPAPPLLVPAENRTRKAKAYAALKHKEVPRKLPCPDNCGVSINWHLNSDHKSGWTARMTLFNWGELPFVDWFVAVEMKKAYKGYDQVYSFNGTKNLNNVKNTIFFQALKGLEYLMQGTNGTKIKRSENPRKTTIECALPSSLPNSGNASRVSITTFIFVAIATFLLNRFH
ncbi:Thiazole biosynthetic enzyme, chloroplast (ARA6) (THI1) (THI4) [Hibiscus syriacus]|uniref:Thiazole biosynthetic enzyme, chloroplast (ARA6) (THI1) (THI4) n=1 Tax=Hibiscus syriacus TaxID=106335 RepID=A0A6A2YNW1_HIBSY|nr:Thiazole biosynthetic enzyme, chloroplast (ARA6) (THI1) (THI4) [Hibiscus syriacus]